MKGADAQIDQFRHPKRRPSSACKTRPGKSAVYGGRQRSDQSRERTGQPVRMKGAGHARAMVQLAIANLRSPFEERAARATDGRGVIVQYDRNTALNYLFRQSDGHRA